MRVKCEVEEVTLEGDCGEVEGVCVRCGRCGHEVDVHRAGADREYRSREGGGDPHQRAAETPNEPIVVANGG